MPDDELVLVIPAAALHQRGAFCGLTSDVECYCPLLTAAAEPCFRHRIEMESDPRWLQLVPYVALRHRGRLFHYTRGVSGGEKRLHALRSVGVGGHINPVDAADGGDPYAAGLRRELAEEVELPDVVAEKLLGFVHDPSTPVGQVHLGVVHLFDLADDRVRPRDPGVAECGFAELPELFEQRSAFESWSRFVIESLTRT